MFDLSTRLLVAYGLIALMVLAAVALVVWVRHNSPRRRHLRERARDAEHFRRRQEAAGAPEQRARS